MTSFHWVAMRPWRNWSHPIFDWAAYARDIKWWIGSRGGVHTSQVIGCHEIHRWIQSLRSWAKISGVCCHWRDVTKMCEGPYFLPGCNVILTRKADLSHSNVTHWPRTCFLTLTGASYNRMWPFTPMPWQHPHYNVAFTKLCPCRLYIQLFTIPFEFNLFFSISTNFICVIQNQCDCSIVFFTLCTKPSTTLT
jgi:hypothetical protein